MLHGPCTHWDAEVPTEPAPLAGYQTVGLTSGTIRRGALRTPRASNSTRRAPHSPRNPIYDFLHDLCPATAHHSHFLHDLPCPITQMWPIVTPASFSLKPTTCHIETSPILTSCGQTASPPLPMLPFSSSPLLGRLIYGTCETRCAWPSLLILSADISMPVP
jgi:hypothetical protein